MPTHEAAGQMMRYLYQVRYAMLLFLERVIIPHTKSALINMMISLLRMASLR